MTARRLRSRAAPPLDSDDLLSEILLRLPPQPSSLPRASAVCRRWRCLVSDPAFLRRFRIHHRRNPPLLGFFFDGCHYSFRPTLEAPNRIPSKRFSFHFDKGNNFSFLGCRHGLVLILDTSRSQVLVWDPITGERHRISAPPELDPEMTPIHGAVLRAAGDGQCFQVVLVAADTYGVRVLACVYSSETGAWGDVISTTFPLEDGPIMGNLLTFFCHKPAVLVGNSLFFWVLAGNLLGILEFDMERQDLALIQVPVQMWRHCNFCIMPAEDGGLGFLFVSEPGFSVQLWRRKNDCDSVTSWRMGRTIEMDKLLPLCNKEKKGFLSMVGFAEDNNVVFMWTTSGIFMVQLESLQIKKLFSTCAFCYLHPFESLYTTGMGIGGGHGAELLHNT